MALVFVDDASHDAKAEATALAFGFGGEEGIENVREHLGRNARTIVDDADDHTVTRRGSCVDVFGAFEGAFAFDDNLAASAEGLDRILNEIGPHLV